MFWWCGIVSHSLSSAQCGDSRDESEERSPSAQCGDRRDESQERSPSADSRDESGEMSEHFPQKLSHKSLSLSPLLRCF